MALDKIIQYDSHPDRDGEALIKPASDGLEKTAGDVHPDVQEYLADAPSLPEDKMRVLITALSAFDTFGPNKNGDGFYREDLLNEMDYGSHPKAESGPLKIPMYRSFEYFARPYKHHINNEDSPAYGKIRRSFFNPKMDRTELVVILDTNKAPEVARRIRNYEPVSTSMGFRAAYDTCSRCGNRASSRAEYCDHLKNEMLEVKPDGHIIHARNPKGKFFDISFLPGVEPADSTSRAVLVGQLSQDGQSEDNSEGEKESEEESETSENEKEAAYQVAGDLSAKVASDRGLNGEEPLRQKTGEDQKISAIDKKVDGEVKPKYSGKHGKQIAKVVKALRESEPLMPKKMVERLSKFPVGQVASSAARCGMTIKPEEAQHMALIRAGAPRLGERLRNLKMMLKPGDSKGSMSGGVELSKEKSNPTVIKIIAGNKPVANTRSMLRPALMKRIKGILGMEGEEKTAALGPNPYLQHRRPVNSTRAYRMASPKEKKQMRESEMAGTGTEGSQVIEYIAQMLQKGQWKGKDDRLPSRAMTRSLQRRPRPARSERGQIRRQPRGRGRVRARRQRRGRQAPAGHSSSMMTAPMMYYMQGVGTHQPIYSQSGMVENAMAKQSSIQKKAYNYINKVEDKMKQIDNRSDQVKQAVDKYALLDSSDPVLAEAAGISLLAQEIE